MRRRTGVLVLIILLAAALLPGFAETAEKGCKHRWELESRVEPTCTGSGKEVYRCALCGKKKTEKLPALGHDWYTCTRIRSATCTQTGITRCYCSRNSNHYKDTEEPALGHDWGEWETVLAPWLTRSGREERTCGRCGEKETKTLPPLIQRKQYELALQVFPGENTAGGVPAEQIAQAGDEGFPLEWICAAANIGKADLWINTDPAGEKTALPAGAVILIPVTTTIRITDLSLDADRAEASIRLNGETEDGEQVCEAGPVSGSVRILPAGTPEQPVSSGLEIRQELMNGAEGVRMGEEVRCAVTVTNRGEDRLSGITVRAFDRAEVLIPEDLAPGESRTVEMTHTIVRQDPIAGYLCWIATAEAFRAGGEERVDAQSGPLIVPVRAE